MTEIEARDKGLYYSIAHDEFRRAKDPKELIFYVGYHEDPAFIVHLRIRDIIDFCRFSWKRRSEWCEHKWYFVEKYFLQIYCW